MLNDSAAFLHPLFVQRIVGLCLDMTNFAGALFV
jgi:hypothetical protein